MPGGEPPFARRRAERYVSSSTLPVPFAPTEDDSGVAVEALGAEAAGSLIEQALAGADRFRGREVAIDERDEAVEAAAFARGKAMTAVLRHGRRGDIDALFPLWTSLWPDRDPPFTEPEYRTLAADLLDDRRVRLWLALLPPAPQSASDATGASVGGPGLTSPAQSAAGAEGEIAGFAICSWRPSIYEAGLMATLELLVVDDRYRRRGIATQLVHAVRATARVVGARRLVLTSNIRRKDAHRFYESLGFHRNGHRFELNP